MSQPPSRKTVCSGERPAKRRTDYKAPEDMKLDPSKKPAHMDIIESNGGKDTVLKGIYVIDGDTLKVCFAPPGDKRPTEFTTAGGSGEQLVVLKRDKK